MYLWVGGSGDTVLRTRKFRNIEAGYRKVALVVDDMVSFDPFIARGIRVYGDAAGPVERLGMVGPGFYCASRRRSRGVGTWPPSRSGRRGTSSDARFTSCPDVPLLQRAHLSRSFAA